MRLFLLKRIGGGDYDENAAFVIRASTERAARILANSESQDEGDIWTLHSEATCVVLAVNGSAEIVLRDYNAG